jgi:hypothetical protein
METKFWFMVPTKTKIKLCITADASGWSLLLNNKVIESGFGSAEEAAECASKGDFSSELGTQALPFSVPSNLNRWRTEDPDASHSPINAAPVQSECANRPWKSARRGSRFSDHN